MTASGSTPCERHSAASDTITAHSAGCTTSTRSSDGAPRPRSTSRSDQSTNGASAVLARVACGAANTG